MCNAMLHTAVTIDGTGVILILISCYVLLVHEMKTGQETPTDRSFFFTIFTDPFLLRNFRSISHYFSFSYR